MDDALKVTATVRIPLSEIDVRVSRSSGPGGQHANKTESRVEVAFDVEASVSLGPQQRARLLRKLGPVVRAVAQDERSQTRNRELALERLAERLREGLRIERPRKATKPTAAAKEQRLQAKRRRSDTKAQRRKPAADD